ncbi:helix-turn-helix domain-containing protein [bacterium]|jgi:excisionase family DNA binding protein|nr:helix-turn-helix domain-containing protein [Candidatus Neomarinimicrobiota bacterium]MBT6454114.1 helix-turn-helix domain-containing protein [Gammaproteobacteria bacterium]MBT6753361.1 helix-turn-helix domain-containing protein [bacterium]
MIHTQPRYSVSDLIQLLRIGRGGVYAAINSGELKTYKVGKRRFASPQAVDDYVALCEKAAA